MTGVKIMKFVKLVKLVVRHFAFKSFFDQKLTISAYIDFKF